MSVLDTFHPAVAAWFTRTFPAPTEAQLAAWPALQAQQHVLVAAPTGSGKTRIVEAADEILFGDARSIIKVDCAEFQHSHEIAKLIGSPPGYLGHRETHPLITQESLAASHTD